MFPRKPTKEQGKIIEAAGLDRWSFLVTCDTEATLTICGRLDDRNVYRIDKTTCKVLNDPRMQINDEGCEL